MTLFLIACASSSFNDVPKVSFWGREFSREQLHSPPEATDTDPDPNSVSVSLTADYRQQEIIDWRTGDVIVVNGYAYNGTTPGPTIRAKVGDEIVVTLLNNLDVPTTIHWHGLDVPNEMDGTPIVQEPVQPGEIFVYSFTVDRAGTAWYHPHFDTDHQVNHGLYGAFIVEDPTDPAQANELIAFLDDWNFATEMDDGSAHRPHDTYKEGKWTVNGLVDPLFESQAQGPLSVRIINASNFGYANVKPPEGSVQIGNDAGLLSQPVNEDSFLLTPGDRAHLLLPVEELETTVLKNPFTHHGGNAIGNAEPLWGFSGNPSNIDLSVYQFDGETPSQAGTSTDAHFVFQGDPNSMRWLINGEQFPNVTTLDFERNVPAIWELRNLSPTHHPFHLHGMAFEVLSRNGVAPEHKQIEDTIDIGIYERVRIRVPMNNPGLWMTHCHILPHGDSGMMTLVSVE